MCLPFTAMRSPLLQNALLYFSLCSRPHPDVSVTKCFQRRTAEFYTDSLFWLMRCKPDIHCRHKRIRRHTLRFMRKGKKKTSKESVSPLYKLSQAFSFSQTDWKIEWSRKVFWSTSSVFIYFFFLIGCVAPQGVIDRINTAMWMCGSCVSLG